MNMDKLKAVSAAINDLGPMGNTAVDVTLHTSPDGVLALTLLGGQHVGRLASVAGEPKWLESARLVVDGVRFCALSAREVLPGDVGFQQTQGVR